MTPKIKFLISRQKDLSTLFSFIEDSEYDEGRSLEWAVFNKYPQFKKYKKEKSIVISKAKAKRIIDIVYKKNSNTIEKNIQIYKKNWREVEDVYYDLVKDLFGNQKWLKGKYIAYATIWGMYPRFLEDKTFHIPFKHKKESYVNVVIAHEMLHFMFYDYFYKKYPKYKNEDNNYFSWYVTEIFNELIQNSPKWLKVFKNKTMGYPEHKEIVKKLANKYYRLEKINVSNIADDIVKEVVKLNLPIT